MKITLDLDKFIEHLRFLRDYKSTDGKTVQFDHVRVVRREIFELETGNLYITDAGRRIVHILKGAL